MQIANLTVPPGAALAPMAGVTHAPMRALCAEQGASITVSEMVSAKALTMGDKKSRALLRGRSPGALYGVQLFGSEPNTIAEAIQRIENEDYDFIDINMGCPAPKIANNGSGSGLLKTPALAGEVAAAAVKASNRPVTVKLRIGWDDNTMTGLEVAQRCAGAGVSLLAVHGRTRAQQYQPGVNYAAVAEIKNAIPSIPILFNGDITNAESAAGAIAKTGCDGVMVGRAAMGWPWIFAELRAWALGQPLPPQPGLHARFAALTRQVQGLCGIMGEEAGMRASRGAAAQYMRGLKGAASLRRQAFALERFTDLQALIDAAYAYQQACGEIPE